MIWSRNFWTYLTILNQIRTRHYRPEKNLSPSFNRYKDRQKLRHEFFWFSDCPMIWLLAMVPNLVLVLMVNSMVHSPFIICDQFLILLLVHFGSSSDFFLVLSLVLSSKSSSGLSLVLLLFKSLILLTHSFCRFRFWSGFF